VTSQKDDAILGAVATFVTETVDRATRRNTDEVLAAVSTFVTESIAPVASEARIALRTVEESRVERVTRAVAAFEDEAVSIADWLAAITPPPTTVEGAGA
jgi:hypothetical protein